MRLALTTRHVDLSPALRRLVDRKVVRLDRLIGTKVVSGQIELSLEKFRHVADVHVHARGGKILHGRAAATSWEEAISAAVDKIAAQAERMTGKWLQRRRAARPVKRVPAAVVSPPPPMARIVRARRYAVRPMSVEEAARSVGERADAFVVFRHPETDAVRVLYRRKDGDLGLIEPDA
ncbi:MAG: ribosome-associated translation inhibitor RaiA [Acidobacteriota bacterium]